MCGQAVAQIKRFIAKRTSCACRTRIVPDHRDAGVPARQLDRLHELAAAAGPEGPGYYAVSPPPKDWDARA